MKVYAISDMHGKLDGLDPVGAVELFYSFDDKDYTMMRNAWFQDNVPVKVGPVAAAPDGNGFEARFSDFTVKHLPDARRLEWLQSHK